MQQMRQISLAYFYNFTFGEIMNLKQYFTLQLRLQHYLKRIIRLFFSFIKKDCNFKSNSRGPKSLKSKKIYKKIDIFFICYGKWSIAFCSCFLFIFEVNFLNSRFFYLLNFCNEQTDLQVLYLLHYTFKRNSIIFEAITQNPVGVRQHSNKFPHKSMKPIYAASIIILRLKKRAMLQAYDQLKQILAKQSYEAALSFVDNYPLASPSDEMLKTNFYCYLTIQRGFKIHQNLTILQGCLAQERCKGPIRALTRYHICQIYFIEDLKACGTECEEIIGEFIGSYHMLKEHMERTQAEEEELVMLQYIIYYCLLLLGYVRGQEGRKEESENYIKASNNLLKINNKSSEFINASNFRTKSAQKKHRMENKTY